MVRGTAKYMSPEQARGMVVDARSDIFSLGSVMYELVTGKAAFDGETASDVIAEILKVEPKSPAECVPDVPLEIEAIVLKALCKERENRYQSVQELLIELQDFKKEAEFQAKLQEPARIGKSPSDRITPARPASVATDQGHASSRRWLWPVAIVLLIAIAVGFYFIRRSRAQVVSKGPRSLAILPFRNLNGDPQTDFLGFSLADEIITKLDYVNALTVRPSSSVNKYRDQVIDPRKVAADLNVDTLLTGSYIKDGNDLRITAQLIDVKPDRILWRDSIDVKYDKLLTVQDRVAQLIIQQLESNLSPAEAANLKPEKPINATAYEDYLRGIDLYSLNDFAAAAEMLRKPPRLNRITRLPGRTSDALTPRGPRCSLAAGKITTKRRPRMKRRLR